MPPSPAPSPRPAPVPTAADAVLESALATVEQHLASLGRALCERDSEDIERHASALHRALAVAVAQFAQAARRGAVPPELRQRLALASGQVAAQRESLARATAALDRAIDVLMPSTTTPAALYSASGTGERSGFGATHA